MTYSRDTVATSELTGQPIRTWSEEWQRKCEARAVLKMAKAERDSFFNGTKDENGKSIDRGITAIRGAQSAEALRELMQQILDARARNAQEKS